MTTETKLKPNRVEKKRLSPVEGGKWWLFPKTPRLLQYASSGTYYARIKAGGKIIRKSLKATVWSAAQMHLVDFLKE